MFRNDTRGGKTQNRRRRTILNKLLFKVGEPQPLFDFYLAIVQKSHAAHCNWSSALSALRKKRA